MGVQERKLREKELRRQSIIKAGSKLFKKIGYLDTSMDMVANEAQLSKGTLYLYFKSKDDLYANCILGDSLKFLNNIFKEAEENSKTVEDAIIAYADAYYEFTNRFPELFDLLMGINSAATFDMANLSDETRERMNSAQINIFTDRIKFLQKGIDDGFLRDNFSTCYTLVKLWVSIVGGLHLSNKKQLSYMFENIEPKEFIRDIAKVFVIAYTKNEDLKDKLHEDIWSNAVKNAPHSIISHSNIKQKIKNNN